MGCRALCFFFFFNDTATTEIYTLSLHDALPILASVSVVFVSLMSCADAAAPVRTVKSTGRDRKSTRLNSSHLVISYAVFCLKKKKPIPGTGAPRGTRPTMQPVIRHLLRVRSPAL